MLGSSTLKKISNNGVIIVIIVGILLLFWQSLFVYFVQDDFFLLSISQIHSLAEFINFFVPLKETVWYRPLSSQIFFFFGKTIFGLNPFPYHVIVFVTHIASSFFLFKLVYSLTKQKLVALLSSVLYSLHVIHTVSLSWLATYSFILGPFFILASLLLYQKKFFTLSFLIFFLGILTTEMLVLFPFVFLSYQFFIDRKVNFFHLFPYFVVSMVVIIVRFFLFPSSVSTNLYSIELFSGFFSTLQFYLFRLIGIPMLIRSMPVVLRLLMVLLSAVFVGLVSFGMIKAFQMRQIKYQLLFFLALFFIGLTPFLFLPQHISAHYLSFSLLGIAPIFSYFIVVVGRCFSSRFGYVYIAGVLLLFTVLHYIGASWTYETHWIFKRALLAERLIKQKNLQHPVGSEEYFSLGANSAYKFINKYELN